NDPSSSFTDSHVSSSVSNVTSTSFVPLVKSNLDSGLLPLPVSVISHVCSSSTSSSPSSVSSEFPSSLSFGSSSSVGSSSSSSSVPFLSSGFRIIESERGSSVSFGSSELIVF